MFTSLLAWSLHVRSCACVTDGRAITLRTFGAHESLFGGIARYADSRRFGRHRSTLVSGTSTAHVWARSGRPNVRLPRAVLSCTARPRDTAIAEVFTVCGPSEKHRVPKTRPSPSHVQSYTDFQRLGLNAKFYLCVGNRSTTYLLGVTACLFHSLLNNTPPFRKQSRSDVRSGSCKLAGSNRSRQTNAMKRNDNKKKNYQNKNRYNNGRTISTRHG